MQHERTRSFDISAVFRSLPATLAALLAVVMAVDILLASQPALLGQLSRDWDRLVAMRPGLAASSQVLAAAAAVASVVITSAVLLAFTRVALSAPHISLAPVWVALCMLSVTRIQVPLPMSTPVFAGLSALAFVGSGTLLRSGSRAGAVCGWALVLLPLVMFGASYADASRTIYPFGRDAIVFLVALGLSALGVVSIAFTRKPDRGLREMEGIDVVEELFTQVERAERSEAQVAELERQLRAYVGQQPAPVRRVR